MGNFIPSTDPEDQFINFDDLEDGQSSSFGDSLNDRFQATKEGGNRAVRLQDDVWNTIHPYKIRDLVWHTPTSSFWVARAANTNSEPSSSNANWKLFGGGEMQGGSAPAATQIQRIEFAGDIVTLLAQGGTNQNFNRTNAVSTLKTKLAALFSDVTAGSLTVENNSADGQTTPTGNYTVAGTNETDSAGTYEPDGVQGGLPAFRLSPTRVIYNNGSYWQVATNYAPSSPGDVRFRILSNAATPPPGVWPSYGGGSTDATIAAESIIGPASFDIRVTGLNGKEKLMSSTDGVLVTVEQDSADEGPAATEEALDLALVRSQRENQALRVQLQTFLNTPSGLDNIVGMVEPQTMIPNETRTYAADTSAGNIVQPIPTRLGRAQSLRFTNNGGGNSLTLTFEDGEGSDILLPNEGDTVTIQTYPTMWRVVDQYPPIVVEATP